MTAGPPAASTPATLRHHDGRFWYVTTNVSDFDAGQLIVHAEDPAGPWSEPVFVPEAIGIDPDLAWDEDGQCYLTWKAMSFTDGEVGILQAPLDPPTGRLLDPAYPVWQGSGLAAAEGPHLYQIDELLVPRPGRGRHRTRPRRHRRPQPHACGPFEGCPANPILTHRSTTHPVQNTGHADLVADGRTATWAAVYLGVRPRGSTPGFHVLGRETFLAGVDWEDGWPSLDESRFDQSRLTTGFADAFDRAEFDQRWVVPGGDPAELVKLDPSGGLWIHPAVIDADGHADERSGAVRPGPRSALVRRSHLRQPGPLLCSDSTTGTSTG